MGQTVRIHEDQVFIDSYTFEEYIDLAESFHGYAAPGIVLGGFMVARAKELLPHDILFDAISETPWCLPDAVQILTPCTIGNGWMKIFNLGLYAVSLYNKFTGQGVRVAVSPQKLGPYPVIAEWLLKLKPKKEQDSDRLRIEMRTAGHSICDVQHIRIKPDMLQGRSKGRVACCSLCGQAYPARDGLICRACQGEAPYVDFQAGESFSDGIADGPNLRMVEARKAVGKTLLHDMTGIDPGRSKGAVFKRKQKIQAGDVCRLQRLGRYHVYVQEDQDLGSEWVHEDDAARAMAEALAGEGVLVPDEIREGKAALRAEHDGLLLVNHQALARFNMVPGVMAATKHSYSLVEKGQDLAGTRAIPLYLQQAYLQQALSCLKSGPVLQVVRIRPRRTGILVTGTEIFQGLVRDEFSTIIQAKVETFGCEVISVRIVPDDRQQIASAIKEMLSHGVELLVTTAGLSVDPEDVTRKGLQDAGVQDMLYGMPILPGAMTLVARAGSVRVIGVPACALYFKTTSFDILLPRILADQPIARETLAVLGHGGFCHNCKNCTYPKCAFAK
jgi:formylmethanofuran dehydrogenase subunit E